VILAGRLASWWPAAIAFTVRLMGPGVPRRRQLSTGSRARFQDLPGTTERERRSA
jgi:hypothetical protein